MGNGLVYLTYNSAWATGRYWHTIPDGATKPLSVKVIDNASKDSTTLVMDKLGMRYHVNDENVGYTAGVNQGIKHFLNTDVEWIFLVNPDVCCPEKWDTVVDGLPEDKNIGIIGGKLVGENGLDHAGGEILDEPRIMYWPFVEDVGHEDYQVLEKRGICTTRFSHTRRDLYKVPRAVAWVTFAFVALRKDMVADIGLLDETYFLYSSDAQYCMRAWQAGWEVWYNPIATFWHEISMSLRTADDAIQQRAVADIRKFAEEETKWLLSLEGLLPKKTLVC